MNKLKTRTLMGEDARSALKRGIDQVYEPVAATIGARGRNAVFDDWSVTITNDGVSIARKINPADPFEKLGADLIKQCAERTNEEAGDGTTTSIVLAHALIEEGNRLIAEGKDPMTVRNLMIEAKNRAIEILKEMSEPVENLFDVANISMENEKIAQIVSDAVAKAGKFGNVIVEESSGYEIEKQEVQGYFWDRGYVSPYMITNGDKLEAVLNDPAVIVTDRGMNLNKELLGALEDVIKSGKNCAFVVADKVDGELLETLITNKLKGRFVCVVSKRPSTTEELEDIATLTNAVAVTSEKGIKEIKFSHVGSAKKVIVKKNETIIIGNDLANINLPIRISNLEKETAEKDSSKMAKERLAKLTNGVVLLKVGAKTEAERHYLRLKIDDAVGACKAALEEGVVEGGGVSLFKIAEELGEDNILFTPLKAPYERILRNAGITPDGHFYDVLGETQVEDMKSIGIVDPTKVERCAIENAVSLASTFLTIESATTDIPEEKNKV